MISSIGFIPNYSEVKELKEYQVDEDIKNKLDYLQIPIIPKESTENEDYERQIIKETDSILFCTPNTEEISNVAFYGYDNEEMYFHHDFFVFSTILSSCFVKDSLVAVATFEPFVFIYDAMIDFPILPQAVLEGHGGVVTAIKNKENRLISCSDDKTIIEWDLVTLKPKEIKKVDVSMERFDFEGENLIFAASNFVNINNENNVLDHCFEQLKIKENNIYVSDCEGNLIIYDVRMPGKPKTKAKCHDGAVLDFEIVDDWIITCSDDRHVKFWKMEQDLILKNDIEQNEVVYSLGFNNFESTYEIFAGTEDNIVYPIKIE